MKFLSLLLACILASASPADADPLSGGRSVQERHNLAADRDDLDRFGDLKDLRGFIRSGRLVRIGGGKAYRLWKVGGHDPKNRDLYRYARPWVKTFLDKELGAAHRKFGARFKITSLVRTGAYQKRICRSGNRAAICGGDWWEQSLHLTGAAVDVSKEGLSRKAKRWLRKRLIALQKQGRVLAIEEAGCFHVFVRKAYDPPKKAAKRKQKKKHRKKRTH